jgi:hypothetical protein
LLESRVLPSILHRDKRHNQPYRKGNEMRVLSDRQQRTEPFGFFYSKNKIVSNVKIKNCWLILIDSSPLARITDIWHHAQQWILDLGFKQICKKSLAFLRVC